jgi:GMP synthase-like glutamine amidotransferase
MKVSVVEHAEHEGPGLLASVFDDLHICRKWKGDPLPDDFDALVVLGGPAAAWDEAHQDEVRLLAESVRAGKPTLGICLGAQLLARSLGGRNFKGPSLEKGNVPLALTDEGRADPLIGTFDGELVAEWHEDTFDLPPDATRLASTAAYENQAFRVGDRVYGIQFHIEVDQTMRREWPLPPGEDRLGLRFAQAFAKLVFSSPRR